jgi:cellulose synthase/poly-beta-1,6-N-acetylglucosamine synthase-like glycosyltransferase
MHINVCICTYRRPSLLKRLLIALGKQKTINLFSYSVIIADNDNRQSAKDIVLDYAEASSMDIVYCVEPRKSISHARNKALEHANGDMIAFIDDDEFPPEDWLYSLVKALGDHNATGVFGPVRPHFDSPPPAWLIKGKFCERPEHETGFIMPWRECRTGNVLIDKKIIDGIGEVFRTEFGAGASDIDLFRRLMTAGHKFIWCNEAFVSEVVSPNRWKRRFMIKRAMLRGRISLLHPEGRWLNILKSLIAVPVYILALPFLQLLGHHVFMEYLIKLCDHLGRLLALVRLNPVQEREM